MLVVLLATGGRVFLLFANPISVSDDRANIRRAGHRGTEILRGTMALRVRIRDAGGRFSCRLSRAHKCHVRCIGLHAAPLEDPRAAKMKGHETAPSVTFARLSRASGYRQGVSGR